MDQAISDFTAGKRIAVIGVSRSGKKFGNTAYTELARRGYHVYAVNPETDEVAGTPCYRDLAALAGKVDGVLVSVPAAQGDAVLREAAVLGIHNVWLQAGAESPELIALGKELGLNVVTGKCILMYAQPVKGFHGWHRAWAKFTHQL